MKVMTQNINTNTFAPYGPDALAAEGYATIGIPIV